MIKYPGMKESDKISNAIVETVDIYPTLTDLAAPKGLDGNSLKPQLEDPLTPFLKAAFAHFRRG